MKPLLLFLLAVSAAARGEAFVITDMPHGWQAEWTVAGCTEAACGGASRLSLNTGRIRQTFALADTDFPPPDAGSKQLPYRQSPLVVDDFNFDGLPDVALNNGNNGLYRSPSYAVYLQNTAGRFALSQDFSDLTLTGMGLFQTDAARQVLITTAKVGCCVHLREEWAVLPNGKLQDIRRTTRDSTAPGKIEITEEIRQHGHWKVHTETITE